MKAITFYQTSKWKNNWHTRRNEEEKDNLFKERIAENFPNLRKKLDKTNKNKTL